MYYSVLENLENIDNLPNLAINEINGDTCFTNGQYKIKATLDKNENLENNCLVNIENKNV